MTAEAPLRPAWARYCQPLRPPACFRRIGGLWRL